MTTATHEEISTNAEGTDVPAASPVAVASHTSGGGWFAIVMPALLGCVLTLLVITPMAYKFWQNMPLPVASVDLQRLIEAEEKKNQDAYLKGGVSNEITDEQRKAMQTATVEFAKNLSRAVEDLGASCKCILVNKAAILGTAERDYTDALAKALRR